MIFFFTGIQTYPQSKLSAEAENLPLNVLLNNVSHKFNIRFAFDDDLLGQINTTLSVSDVETEKFLDALCERYGLQYRLIAGTYVLYVDDEARVAEAIQATEAKKQAALVKVEEEHVYERQKFEITLSGMIQNLRSGEKLRFCRIVFDSTIVARTNEMGFFQVSIETDGEVKIEISHLGFVPYDTTLVLLDSTYLVFGLAPIPQLDRLSGIRLTPLKFMIEIPDLPEMIAYNPQTTYQLPGAESNDLVNALTIIPGINYLKGTDAGLSIRGGAPSDNLVLIDGIPMAESSHLMGNLSTLNSKYIQQAFVSRGGFGAEYGGRTAGIVDLTGKAGSNEKTIVDFTANMLHTNVYVGVPIDDRTSISGAFRKSFVDVWPRYHLNNFAVENKTLIINDGDAENAYVESTAVSYSDVNFKLTFRPNSYREINFNLFDSSDRLEREYTFPVEGDYYQQNSSNSRNIGYSANVKLQSPFGWLNTFSAGFSQMRSESVSENGKSPLFLDQPVRNFFDADRIFLREFRAAWNSELQRRWLTQKFGAGYNYNFIDYKYEDHEIKIPGANHFNDSISSVSSVQLFHTYYQAELMPLKWLRFRAGVRGLYNPEWGGFQSQPRYGLELIPASSLKFHYSAGRYLQYMYLTQRIDTYKNPSPIWFIPESRNQNLDAFHHIAGIRLERNNILLNVEAYHKRNSNKIFFIGEPGMLGILPIVNYNLRQGEELDRGIDLLFQVRGNHFKHLISYSLSESFDRIEGVNNTEFFHSFDHQLHRLRITEIVRWRNWTASTNWYFANGMPHLTTGSTPEQLEFGLLPNFMQLDVSLVKQFDFNLFYADIGFTILNVLDRTNQLSVKNYVLPEGVNRHSVKAITTATSFSPLFFINLRYE